MSTFAVNMIAFSHGCVMGWLSPYLSYLKSSDTHLITGPLTPADVSWIGSLICVGGFIGTVVVGTITEKIGKKYTLFLLVIPNISFWGLVFFSTHVYHLYFARFIAGITGGSIMKTVSLFITEISENKIRGMLGSFFVFATSGGTLLIFIMGTYMDFFAVPIIIQGLPMICLTSMFFIHDTPTSLISRKKYDKAFEALKFYRSCDNDKLVSESIKAEFEHLKKALESEEKEKLESKDFCEWK